MAKLDYQIPEIDPAAKCEALKAFGCLIGSVVPILYVPPGLVRSGVIYTSTVSTAGG
jgi:hypothetical protein